MAWVEEVAHEIRDHDLKAWLEPLIENMIETDEAIWSEAHRLQVQFNPDLHLKGINGVDAFVIAAAMIHSLAVITGEKSSSGLPKIPNVCQQLDLSCVTFLTMMRQEAWTF